MAWIQVHQQLKDHRKLLAAADELEIEPPHMLGLLTSFWLWALDNAPSGSLEGISNRNIARAAQWNKEPDAFVEAMKSAGFLDITEYGTLEIHDWYEYAGKLIDQREAENRDPGDAALLPLLTVGRPPDNPKDSRRTNRKTASKKPEADYTRLHQSRLHQRKKVKRLTALCLRGRLHSSRSLTCITKSARVTRF